MSRFVFYSERLEKIYKLQTWWLDIGNALGDLNPPRLRYEDRDKMLRLANKIDEELPTVRAEFNIVFTDRDTGIERGLRGLSRLPQDLRMYIETYPHYNSMTGFPPMRHEVAQVATVVRDYDVAMIINRKIDDTREIIGEIEKGLSEEA